MAASTGMYFTYRTPHGLVTIRSSDRGITHVTFGNVVLPGVRHPSQLATHAANELLEYFAGKRRAFDIPLDAEGTAFQHAVWSELTHIPYGHACTTTEIASLLGKPESYRSVGAAIKRNPVAILVPDHRVVGPNCRPIGTDVTARLKGALLDMERKRLQ